MSQANVPSVTVEDQPLFEGDNPVLMAIASGAPIPSSATLVHHQRALNYVQYQLRAASRSAVAKNPLSAFRLQRLRLFSAPVIQALASAWAKQPAEKLIAKIATLQDPARTPNAYDAVLLDHIQQARAKQALDEGTGHEVKRRAQGASIEPDLALLRGATIRPPDVEEAPRPARFAAPDMTQ